MVPNEIFLQFFISLKSCNFLVRTLQYLKSLDFLHHFLGIFFFIRQYFTYFDHRGQCGEELEIRARGIFPLNIRKNVLRKDKSVKEFLSLFVNRILPTPTSLQFSVFQTLLVS